MSLPLLPFPLFIAVVTADGKHLRYAGKSHSSICSEAAVAFVPGTAHGMADSREAAIEEAQRAAREMRGAVKREVGGRGE